MATKVNLKNPKVASKLDTIPSQDYLAQTAQDNPLIDESKQAVSSFYGAEPTKPSIYGIEQGIGDIGEAYNQGGIIGAIGQGLGSLGKYSQTSQGKNLQAILAGNAGDSALAEQYLGEGKTQEAKDKAEQDAYKASMLERSKAGMEQFGKAQALKSAEDVAKSGIISNEKMNQMRMTFDASQKDADRRSDERIAKAKSELDVRLASVKSQEEADKLTLENRAKVEAIIRDDAKIMSKGDPEAYQTIVETKLANLNLKPEEQVSLIVKGKNPWNPMGKVKAIAGNSTVGKEGKGTVNTAKVP